MFLTVWLTTQVTNYSTSSVLFWFTRNNSWLPRKVPYIYSDSANISFYDFIPYVCIIFRELCAPYLFLNETLF